MKNKLICMAYIVGMFFSIGLILKIVGENYYREHQHLMAEEKMPCSHDEDMFCTHLPLISITTDGKEITSQSEGEELTQVEMEVFDKELYNNHLRDVPDVTSLAYINYRGNTSKDFDKKQYDIKLINQDATERKIELLGMPEHDKWVLNGPFYDKTLIRNYLGMNISAEIMGYAPRVRFCEVIIDGSYKGLYVLMEKIQVSEDRVDMMKYEEGDWFTSYLVRLDRGGAEGTNLNQFSRYAMKTHSVMNVIYPPQRYLNEELIGYIEQDISRFEKTLYSYDYKDRMNGYHKYINVQSFVDYMIINEFFQNQDAGTYSTYLYKDIKGKLNIGPVWDFNNMADNYFDISFNGTGFSFVNKVWYNMLLKDYRFTRRVIERYEELRKTVLSEQYLLDYIDDTVNYLGEAIERNFGVWGYSFVDDGIIEPEGRQIGNYKEAIEQLKSFIVKRGRWLDENIGLLYQYSHPSKNKKFNH